MISPDDFLRVVIDPGLTFLSNVMGRDMGGDPARVILLAICKQESDLEHRRQLDSNGNPMEQYARGFPQFEKGGGVHGVCTHSASKDAAVAVCSKLGIPFNDGDIHQAFAWNDYLALTFARLLLFTDPKPLPEVGDEQGAWDCYIRNWRPGKPKRDRWATIYPQAVATIAAAAAAPVATLPFIVPKPGTLTSKKSDGTVQVDLPSMNRSWATGEFWLTVFASASALAIQLSPIIDPAFDALAENPAIASSPIAAALFAIARQWYKAQRMKYAAQVASAETAPSPTATVVGTVS